MDKSDDYYEKVKENGLTQHQEDLIAGSRVVKMSCTECKVEETMLDVKTDNIDDIAAFEKKHRRCFIKLVPNE